MADLTITAANVVADPAAHLAYGKAGVAITAGQVVYFDTPSNSYKLADDNSATAAARSPDGIATNGAAVGQTLGVAKSGRITIGATLAPGTSYYLSKNAGGICPFADLGTGEYASSLGIATSTTVLKLDIQESGAAL
jgi:hypothetical protein